MEEIKDSWRGPDERPEAGQSIKVYYFVAGRVFPAIGRYYFDSRNQLGYFTDENSDRNWWSNIICWQPITFSSMPERFKKENTK